MPDIAERVATLEANEKTIFYQLDEVKNEVKDIHRMTLAVEKIATKTDGIDKKVDGIDKRLNSVEKEPLEDYNHYRRVLVSCLITGAASAILGAILALIIK